MTRTAIAGSAICLLLVIVGCGGPAVSPSSATVHDAKAQRHDEMAVKHEATAKGKAPPHHIDWSDATSKEQVEEAARHRALAAKHRARSQALRDSESQACDGLEEDDRDEGPFAHKQDIVSVEPIVVTEGKQAVKRQSGSRIVFRAVHGLTEEWLQRLVACRLAVAKALNYEASSVKDDVLAIRGIRVKVRASGPTFVVDIEADDAASVSEIRRRVQATLGNSSAPQP